MDEPKTPGVGLKIPVRILLTVILVASALLYQGYNLTLALDPDDSNHLETPLTLAIARELVRGPGSLYGPFTGENPLVLIHAPLYYRLAALGALPLVRSGVDPAIAAMISGRGLSFLGMLITLAAAAWIAGMDEPSWFSRAWAACLIASAGVFGSFPATVRPDALAVGLQTLGFAIVVKCLRDGKQLPIFAAFLAFALAFCMKQHMIVAAGVAVLLLGVAVVRARLRALSLLMPLLAGGVAAFAYFFAENSVTHGEMWRAVFLVPGELGTTESGRGSWSYVATVSWETAKRSLGLIALGLSLLVTSPRKLPGTRIDGALWLALAFETAAIVPLCLKSSGAWVNYAMPSAVWGSILLARWLNRATADVRIGFRPALYILASFLVLFGVYRLVRNSADPRRADRQLVAMLLEDPAVGRSPREVRYFVGLPQFNRMHGNVGLAHDEWLYNQFEGLGEAEPRDRWLKAALGSTVHLVIVPASSPAGAVPGVSGDLPDLGYRQIRQIGQYALWSRDKDEP